MTRLRYQIQWWSASAVLQILAGLYAWWRWTA